MKDELLFQDQLHLGGVNQVAYFPLGSGRVCLVFDTKAARPVVTAVVVLLIYDSI